jgi:hypothetical protein
VRQFSISLKTAFLLRIALSVVFACTCAAAFAQVPAPVDSLKADSLGAKGQKVIPPHDDLRNQYDITDLARNIFHPGRQRDSAHKSSGIIIVPNIAANPTIGFQLGIKAVAGRKLGDDPNTLLSVASTSASATTKGILYFYVNHNIFTNGNKWNLQGNLVASHSVTPDHGLGIGVGKAEGPEDEQILANPDHIGYAVTSEYYNFREKIYKHIAKNFFLGAGVSFDIRRNINTKDTALTPLKVYNIEHGFPQDHYSANGWLLNVQYTTRDNQNRPYKGVYFDAGIRANQTWMGSTKNSVQLTTDIRKYISLSDVNPEMVLALWNWGSYLLSGEVPYLELPGTARDGAFKSGRGYVAQYFKAPLFNDTEAEFRFPITRNKFISGVAFASAQTANDEQGTKLFQVFQPGGGGGLRVLFSKFTRTNLDLDYAFGKFGNKGFFLNLNEVF